MTTRDDAPQALNYSAHALEDLRRLQEAWWTLAPKSAMVMTRILEMLEESTKFVLPNCCELIAPGELRQAHVDIARLPFPCVAFEAPWQVSKATPQNVGGIDQQAATKRIALCWEACPEFEPRPGLNDWLEYYPQGGIFILPIFWGPQTPGWLPGVGGVFCPYDNILKERPIGKEPMASQMAIAAAVEAGVIEPDAKRLIGEPFVLFPEMFDLLVQELGSKDKANSSIMLDSRDESFMQLQVCAVLGCANVGTVDVDPSVKLNKKRVSKGNQPFFSYKVLELDDERAAPSGPGQGGQHASPRRHLRRGHIRRLQTNRVVWVRPSMVNANSPRGVVDKDYRVSVRKGESVSS